MDGVVYREMRPEDVSGALALRNQVFARSVIGPEAWAADDMVVSIAVVPGGPDGEEYVGAIPLSLRDFVVAPGVTIRAPFENAVGTRADLRSRGIGSGMIAEARRFMRGRADGLFVYRGVERSQGYRFYVKSGHHDLLYTRVYRLQRPEAVTPRLGLALRRVAGAAAIQEQAERLLPVFQSSYSRFGGYPRRVAGYWRRALASSIYAAIPTDFHLVLANHGDALVGYAILGIRRGQQADGALHVMEMATSGADPAIAADVLAGAAGLAVELSGPLVDEVSDEDPFVPALRALGFEPETRWTIILGQLLDAAECFDRHWRPRVDLAGVGLRVWTPAQEALLLEPRPGYPTLSLEMKDETLHRWLLGRVDLAARVREGTVTAFGAGEAALRALGVAIPATPWAYHQLDWI